VKLAVVAMLASLALQDGAPPRFAVSVREVEGDQVCSIQARQARLIDLLQAVGEQLDVNVQGLEYVPRQTRMTVELRRRPVREVLDYMLRSVGLEVEQRVGALIVREDLKLSVDELRASAQAAYIHALRAYPNHELAPSGMLGQAQVEESSGNLVAARMRYDDLVDTYPDSELVPRAMARSAELFMEEEEWAHAAQRYADLLRLEYEHGYEVEAYTNLALCTTMLGDHERALHMLDAFESLDEPVDREDWLRRQFVRARALIGLKQLGRAAAILDDADAWAPEGRNALVSSELRARLLSAKGLDAEASRAWLALARDAAGTDRDRALREAARHALAAEDDMGVFFIERFADELGSEADLSEEVHQARARLGIDWEAERSSDLDERLERIERRIAAGSTEGLIDQLERLDHLVEGQDEALRMRVLLARGAVLAEHGSLDEAVELFRVRLPGLTDPEHRRRVYLLAAELFEKANRMDEAIEAYRGRL